ncbi:MAG: hypothetical protein V1723_04360 [Candidatus Uhrbacteria bacterium]
MIWFIYALAYAFVGAFIGSVYAFLTGGVGPHFADVVGLGVVFGPVVLMVIAGFREVAVKAKIPIARAIYHTSFVAFTTPMLCFGVALLADESGLQDIALMARAISYWMIPLVFMVAALYGLHRVIEGNRPRASGVTGGSPPTIGDGGSCAPVGQA